MTAPARQATHVPLRVTAHLAAGLTTASPWGVALDGLLAAQLWADHKTAEHTAGRPTPALLDVDQPPDLPLPLARCTLDPTTWHWTATCAHPTGGPAGLPPDVHWWSGRTDHRTLEHLTPDLPAALPDRRGRWRARRMPLLVTPCTAVVWHAVGDPTAVRALLTDIAAIGKKRATGEGHVTAWTVTPAPDLDLWTAAHLHPDGTLGRPTPPACLTGHPPVLDGGLGTAALRPPHMHPARQQLLHLPALLDR